MNDQDELPLQIYKLNKHDKFLEEEEENHQLFLKHSILLEKKYLFH